MRLFDIITFPTTSTTRHTIPPAASFSNSSSTTTTTDNTTQHLCLANQFPNQIETFDSWEWETSSLNGKDYSTTYNLNVTATAATAENSKHLLLRGQNQSPNQFETLENWGWTKPRLLDENNPDDKGLIGFLQLGLLDHYFSGDCIGDLCMEENCSTMKRFLAHGFFCTQWAVNEKNVICSHCLEIWSLLSLHARHCTKDKCLVPYCKELSA